ncbi:hypothetical protein REPUB_Repub05bG0181900 [Reevesia pubescens]
MVVLQLLELHFDPKFWGPDAEKFNPESFSNGISRACKSSQAYNTIWCRSSSMSRPEPSHDLTSGVTCYIPVPTSVSPSLPAIPTRLNMLC